MNSPPRFQGIAVGVPTISNQIFLIFFCLDPPVDVPIEEYPWMANSRVRWKRKSYHLIQVHNEEISLIRHSLQMWNTCIEVALRGVRGKETGTGTGTGNNNLKILGYGYGGVLQYDI